MGAGDPVDPALGEQRRVEDARRGDIARALEVHAAHPEVTELILVRDPGDLRLVADAAVSQLEFEVDDVFERCSLARAGPVADADEELSLLAAAHPLHLFVQPPAAWAAWSGRQTDRLLPSGPRPGVLSNRSAGPVALIRKS